MIFMHICPRCGAKEGTVAFFGPFCENCFEPPIRGPDRAVCTECKTCGKIKYGGLWDTRGTAEKRIRKKFRGAFESVELDLDTGTVTFVFADGGAIKTVKRELGFEMNKGTCPDCSKKSGGYYEAIVQFRGAVPTQERLARELSEFVEHAGSFISKTEFGKDGIDLHIGSCRPVLAWAKRTGLEYKVSTKLAGMREGKRWYRPTYAFRV
jgi:NMD protein affecting ribosome stability and mRNA decay